MHQHAVPSLYLWRNTIRADQQTCLSLSNFMTSRRTHHEPTLTLQFTGSLQSTCLQLTVQPSLCRAHRTPLSASTTGCTPLLCKLNCLLTRRSSVHRDHNTSPLCEVQLATTLHLYVKSLHLYVKFQSASREPKQLHTGCITKCGCAFTVAYIPYPKDQANRSSFK